MRKCKSAHIRNLGGDDPINWIIENEEIHY